MGWVEDNLDLLRTSYPDLDYRAEADVHWVRISAYSLPVAIWTSASVEVAFRIPSQAGEAPYGFWVRPGPTLTSGASINNYTFPVSNPWGDDWGQFSFSPDEAWQPKADVRAGPNMLNFARAIAGRLQEGA